MIDYPCHWCVIEGRDGRAIWRVGGTLAEACAYHGRDDVAAVMGYTLDTLDPIPGTADTWPQVGLPEGPATAALDAAAITPADWLAWTGTRGRWAADVCGCGTRHTCQVCGSAATATVTATYTDRPAATLTVCDEHATRPADHSPTDEWETCPHDEGPAPCLTAEIDAYDALGGY